MVVVRNLVGKVRQLRLETGLQPLQEPLAEFAELAGVGRRAVLEDAFAHFEGEIQAWKFGVALLQLVHHPQRLQVVLEPAELAHAIVERVLPGVTERGVAEIVREADRLDQRLVQAERPRHAARDLRHLERMREARAVEIAFVIDEDLRLVDEPAERRRMHDAVAVALVFGAMTRRWLGKATATRCRRTLCVDREDRVVVAARHVAAALPAHAATSKWPRSVACSASAG